MNSDSDVLLKATFYADDQVYHVFHVDVNYGESTFEVVLPPEGPTGSTIERQISLADETPSPLVAGDSIRWYAFCRLSGEDGEASPTRWIRVIERPTITINNTFASFSSLPLVIDYSVTADPSLNQPNPITVGIKSVIPGRLYESKTKWPLEGTVTFTRSDLFGLVDGEDYEIFAGAFFSQTGYTVEPFASFQATAEFSDLADVTLDIDNADNVATLTVDAEEPGAGQTAVESLAVSRLTDYGSVLLADEVEPGITIVDKFAPLNVEYTYQITAQSVLGTFEVTEFTNEVESGDNVLMYGDDVITGTYEPSLGFDISRPDRKLVHYWGRKDPVPYDSKAITQSRNLDFAILGTDIAKLTTLMDEYSGLAVFKSATGEVMHVAVDVSGDFVTGADKATSIGTKLTKVDGDVL